MDKSSKVVVNSPCFGIIWIVGWLFTIGFAKLSFWSGALALLIWPYHLGALLSNIK